MEVYCQQIEGSFPNFEPLIDKDLPLDVRLDVDELQSALRRANLFAGAESRVVRLGFDSGMGRE